MKKFFLLFSLFTYAALPVIAILLFMAFAPSNVTAAPVQGLFCGAGSGGSAPCSNGAFGSSVTAHNTILATVICQTFGCIPGATPVSDNQGDTYKLVQTCTDDVAFSAEMLVYEADNVVGGLTTPTLNFNVGYDATFEEMAGLPANSYDTFRCSSGTSAAPSSLPSPVTAYAHEYVMGILSTSAATSSAGAGFTSRISNGFNLHTQLEDLTTTVTGAQTATFTTTNNFYFAGVFTFHFDPFVQNPIRSMGYDVPYGLGYMDMTKMNWGAVTHIAFMGGCPNADGSISLSNAPTSFASTAPGVITAAHAHNVKVLLSLTNLNGFSACAASNFTGAITNHEALFMTNIMSIVNTYGFDGVAVDDEEAFNGTLLTTMFTDLRSNLGSGFLEAEALPLNYTNWNATIAANLDLLIVEGYALASNTDNCTYFNAGLASNFSIDNCAVLEWNLITTRYLQTAGISASKLGIGMPFYGQFWTGNNGPRQTYGANTETDKFYYQVVAQYTIASAVTDSIALVPWIAVSGSSWVNYDNPISIARKVDFVHARNLSGFSIFSLNYDNIGGLGTSYPLMDSVANELKVVGSGTGMSAGVTLNKGVTIQ